jgi:hypothetical protein
VSCDETSLQALQASGLVGESLDLSLLATPGDIKGEQGKSWVIPDPWTLSCHKKFPQKPKNRHFEGRFFGVLGPQGSQNCPSRKLSRAGILLKAPIEVAI